MSRESFVDGMSKEDFSNFVVLFNPHANTTLITKAYDFAKKAHAGQKRISGDDHFDHVLNVAYILAKLHLDTQTICAGILHDVIEDTAVTREAVKKAFGEEVLELIEGVTKIEEITLESTEEKRAENLRKVLFATLKDIRVMIIKLADRLHNMRTLKYHAPEKQKIISRETLDIYVPVAYKLGMYRLKSEMEDLSLRYLTPDVYQDLKNRVAMKKEERDREIRQVVDRVSALLNEKGIEARIYGRAKNFYSIYKKMQKKELSFEQIRDLYAIRIILKNVDDCYRALGVIHSAWPPIIESFDDYIATPKPNMYQSLHTEVLIDKKTVEVQIRTWDMHHIAEEGIAAHWQYKDTERDKKFDRRVAWLKQILEWKTTSRTAKEFVEDVKIDIFKDEIFVLTPKGDPIPLPEKATPLDFAYAVHTDIGNHCVRAKVNGNIMPLNAELKAGDVCEIMTSKNIQPSRNWLKFVKTSLAKGKIRQALHLGRETEMKHEEQTSQESTAHILEDSVKESQLKVAKCCNPAKGTPIIGYHMKNGKVAVHRAACPNVKTLETHRMLRLNWKEDERKHTNMRLEVVDRIGLFSDILDVFSTHNIKVDAINTKHRRKRTYVIFEVEDREKAAAITPALKKIKNVVSVQTS